MSTTEFILILVCTLAGVVVGAVIAMQVIRKQSDTEKRTITDTAAAAAAAQEKSFRERIDEKDLALHRLDQELCSLRIEATDLREKLARALETTESSRREMASLKTSRDEMITHLQEERQKAIDELNRLARTYDEKMKEAFDALSIKALRGATDEFMKLAQETFSSKTADAKQELEQRKVAIETLLKPIQENLEKLDKQCIELETKREVAYNSIEHHVSGLLNAASDLNNALRKPTLRGSWGEMTLTTVVENAGLQEGVHFVLQHSTDTEDGRLRADMVVNLPKNRHIAIDSKATLDSFRNAVNCIDETQREELMKKHAAQVRSHMKQLSEKKYWQQYEGLDCVFMFLPSEAMFYSAVQYDPDLMEDARKNRVYLANPSTLMATLNAVAYVLDQERLNNSAKEISQIGRNLHDGVRVFAGHMDKLGRNLRLSVDSYNASVKSLEKSVLPRTRQLREKGVGGDEIEEMSAVEALPIGFQARELVAGIAESQERSESDSPLPA